MKKRLIVVVDMVNGFINQGNLHDPYINHIAKGIKSLIEEALESGDDIVSFRDCHTLADKEFETFPIHCLEGTEESELVPELKPFANKMIDIPKNTTNGFETEQFKTFYETNQNKYREIIVVGCCTDICITDFATSLAHFHKTNQINTPITVPMNLVETFDGPNHDRKTMNDIGFQKLKQARINLIENIKQKEGMKMNQIMSTDRYEFTMANGYFEAGKQNEIAYFDVFFRKNPFKNGYTIMAGLDQIIKAIKELHFEESDLEYFRQQGTYSEAFLEYLKNFKFQGDIYAIPDGTPIFPNEPVITIKANVIESQILETMILSHFNSAALVATAAKRIVMEAKKPVMEFGSRRSHTMAAIDAGKNAYLAGCVGTSNEATGKYYGVPTLGTMAHSWITAFDNEYEAFLTYAKHNPENTIFLVDTYDTLKTGIPNAIRVAQEYLTPNNIPFKGIRIDSGDLAYLSKQARIMLDEAGYKNTTICLSNGLTAETIRDLNAQGVQVDSYGVGDNIAAPLDRLGGVYKLVALEKQGEIIPKIKVSSDKIKTINPSYKKVYRFYDKRTGYALGDVVALKDEFIPTEAFTLIDPNEEWKKKEIKDYEVRELQVPIFKNGTLVYEEPSLEERRDYCTQQMDTLYDEVTRLEKPHKYYVDLTEELLKLKKELIESTTEIGYQKKLGGLCSNQKHEKN